MIGCIVAEFCLRMSICVNVEHEIDVVIKAGKVNRSIGL
jgi:hypothetical protein